MKKFILGFLALFLFITSSAANQIKPYEIVHQKNTSFANRLRAQIFIVSPDAQTLEQRVDTAKIAATDYSLKTNAKVVSVFLVPFKQAAGTGYNYAIANYWSDGCGNSGTQCNNKQWEVNATDQQLTDLELKIAYEYYANLNKFLDKYGLPDEQKLTSYVAKKLKIKTKDANPTMLFLESIE
ncbi:DUF4875 domain-containing protein [Utexia brackfieldae]|uniref:DUF4875 domain-containing protein n=1 Tax=Utexia brackfieldae TaxID=3074108 RepID=UPI00370D7000